MADSRITLDEYLARIPDDAAWAEGVTAPYRSMSPEDRLQSLSELNAWMDVLLAGKLPVRQDGEPPFWTLWTGAHLGRSR